ncbi:hypothetical protein G3O00_35690 [Burkholderia sp. Ac-20384]|uniref:hypothetical protein n=1 Tax=Burkholderia sp. Ac-20384 TaxID=2703902 RepID=UPI00197F5F37|nr:hypothetical protein [Burkholderia sp. Ac-20384]MBN3828909.1 hypothetical protein [Burkholderia sp. Ac-20384]
MLANSAVDDQVLVIATGTFGFPSDLVSAVSTWFKARDSRRILFVIGLHGQLELSPYKQAQAKNGPHIPLTYAACGGAAVRKTLGTWIERLEAKPDELDDRVVAYAVAHFHAKFYMLLGPGNPQSDYLYLETTADIKWDVREAIFGSTNTTTSAVAHNFELDLHIGRGDPMIPDLAVATLSLIEHAMDSIDVSDVSRQVSMELADVIADEIGKRQLKEYNASQKKLADAREANEKGITDADEYREKHDNEYP